MPKHSLLRVHHEQNQKPFSAKCVGVHQQRHWKRQANLLALHTKSLSLILMNCTGGIGGLGQKGYAFISLPIGSSAGRNVLHKVAQINAKNGILCLSVPTHISQITKLNSEYTLKTEYYCILESDTMQSGRQAPLKHWYLYTEWTTQWH